MDILLFGDQAVEVYPYLHRLLFQREHTTSLTAFLNHVSSALRADIANLPRLQRQKIPPLINLLEFLEAYRKAPSRSAPVESALLCIAQLAHISEECPDLLSSERSAIGLCTGLLAAAAVSTYSSTTSFVSLAVETVRIAFRIGLQVESAADQIRTKSQDNESWSVIVSGVSEGQAKRAIESFHERAATSIINCAYISAISPSGVTVSGPPDTLRELLESSELKSSRTLQVRIAGPYHASHLYTEATVRQILKAGDSDVLDVLNTSKPGFPIFSASSGTCYNANTAMELLEQIVADVLVKPLNMTLIFQECVSMISAAAQDCRVIPIGPTNAAASVISSLQSKAPVKISLLDYKVGEVLPGRRGNASLQKSKIAIVGMSGRFPGGSDVEKFWDVLMQGLDMHKEVPGDRFDAQAHYDPSGKAKNASHTPYGCFIDNAGLFDPRFFNMSPREAIVTDPMQRLSLTTAFEAMEMAGLVPNRTPSSQSNRIGTFYGQTSDDWREINEAQDIDTYFITGGVRAFGPGRINYHFKFSGPSFNVDTACSSSMAAIQIACTSLQAGECDTAIAGGANVMTNPDIFSGLSKGQFLSKTGSCKTFDNDADGYCRGDGVATVILKRLEDAEADNDKVLGVILASATNHSADAISITHPHAGTQEILYKKVLDQAGVDPLDVSYVEMHGTGTQAGDGTEMKSVTNVFSPSGRKRQAHQKLYLGSVKANVGHGEAVSGVTALVKTLLMLRHNRIPPHIGIKGEMNKSFPEDLPARNVHIAFQSTALERRTDPRRIFVNNFSAAGGNTAILVEDGPIRQLVGKDPRPVHVVSVSARALSSLKGNLKNLATYIAETPEVSLSSLAYTTTARRIHQNYRVSVVAKDLSEVQVALRKAAEADVEPMSSAPRIAFTFTGQGSHYASLGADLFETCAQFKTDLLDFDSIAKSLGYPSFIPLINGEAPDVSVLSPLLVQVGLTCIQMALSRLWGAWGVKPDVVIGHSLGEYAALNAAGVLSVSDTIFLVGERARLLESKCTAGSHAMLAVKTPVSSISDLLGSGRIEVACMNGATETVLSGTSSDIDNAKSILDGKGYKSTKLPVPYAFHSSQVEIIIPEFQHIASSINFKTPTIPVLSPLLRGVMNGSSIDAVYLGRHARETVNFLGALTAGLESKLINDQTVFVELGPHPVTLSFVKSTIGTSVSGGASLRRNESAWTSLASTASLLHNKGASVDWNEYHRDFVQSLEMLELPAYSFALKNYWIDYKNNWCLTKGEMAIAPVAATPKLSTTSVQNVIHEEYSNGKGTLIAESETSRPDLYAAISGHLVNGAALCPSSIYGDVGVTIGEHMYRQMHGLPVDAPVPGMNVRNMEVPKPLIAKPGVPLTLKMTAHADKAKGLIDLVFSTGATEHAKCIVEFGDISVWLSEWQRVAYMVEGRMDALKTRALEGKSEVLLKGMAYKLFAALVQYEETYRGMQRVILDGKNNEATANVVCQQIKETQNFNIAPYWIDSVGHLGGFVMNANDELDSRTQVYVSHGWESMRFSKPLVPGENYQTYVRMLPAGEGKMVVGDVYLFHGGVVIGLIGGLKFQCVPRKVLDMLLPPPGAVAHKAMPTITQEVTATKTVIEKKKPSAIQTIESKITIKQTATITSQVLEIIAEECGVDLSELADGNSFADLGVDSLMQLAISGRMRETLELDVHSTLFADCPSVGALKGWLSAFEPVADGNDISRSTTPSLYQSDSDHGRSHNSSNTSAPGDTPKEPGSPTKSEEAFVYGKTYQGIEANISQEQIKKSSGLQVEELSRALSMDLSIERLPTPTPIRNATSVILQGSPKTATKNLFLFPDGGGAAASYAGIPRIAPNLCLYGLNSPFMKTPHEYKCGLAGVTEIFVQEVRRRQPHGPYNVGGWSAGGVIAFEAAQQLIAVGEKVDALILIDSPCPLIIEPLPSSLHKWFGEIGLLGDGDETKIPSWLLPHFSASIDALSTYSVRRIDPAKAPKTFTIWCEDGICKLPSDPRPDPYPYGHAQFLLENKTDFGPGLWDTMVGKENVVCCRVSGNHFSMMKEPHIQQLGDEIRKALA